MSQFAPHFLQDDRDGALISTPNVRTYFGCLMSKQNEWVPTPIICLPYGRPQITSRKANSDKALVWNAFSLGVVFERVGREATPAGRRLSGQSRQNDAVSATSAAGLLRDGGSFEAFLDSCPKREEFLSIRSELVAERVDEVARFSTRLIGCLLDAPIPQQVEKAVLGHWHHQGEERTYAVRSSATVEDGAQHSFAGQFESFLNIRGENALLSAVKKCWLLLFSLQALAYQKDCRLLPDKVGMAVVVQEMVPAEAAGVLFTAEPVSGSASRMIIEATSGLGDRLVSGRVNPTRIVLNKASLRVLRQQASAEAPGLPERSRGESANWGERRSAFSARRRT